MEESEYPFEITFNTESGPEEAFFAIYAALRMFCKHEQDFSTKHNEGLPKNEQTFSIPGAQSYCLLQDLLSEHPAYYALAEERFNRTFIQ